MPKFIIEREIPNAATLSPSELKAISRRSCDVLQQLGVNAEAKVLSAHRAPGPLHQYVEGSTAKVFICAAGGPRRSARRVATSPCTSGGSTRSTRWPSSAAERSPSMPNSSLRWLRVCASSAFFSSALEGMHPTFRQTPPQYFSSTTATFLPSWAARMAAT